MRRKRIDRNVVEEKLPLLVDRLSAFQEVGAVFLFGSFARGNPGKLSDIDIAVLVAEGPGDSGKHGNPGHLEYIVAASGALGTDRLDVVILNAAPLPLRHAVFRDGRLLFLRDRGALARFREESMRKYLDTDHLRRIYREAYFERIRERGFGRSS